MIPGEYIFDGPDLELNAGRPVVTLSVNNTGDRPIQVGSHYHFFETNRALVFDREKAYGTRLDLPERHVGAVRAGRHEGGPADPLRGASGGLRVQRAGVGPVGRPLHEADEPEALHRGRLRQQDIRGGPRLQDAPRPQEQGEVTDERATLPQGLREEIRADDRRPHPAGRQRADHRDREGLHRLRRGVDLRRREVDPRRAGPVPPRRADEPSALRPGRHQRGDHRPLGDRQGGHRHPGGPDRRRRQVGQPADPGGRRSPAGDRAGHRDHRGRGPDRGGGRRRHAHPLHLPPADRDGDRLGDHDPDRRRHRLGHGDVGDDLHARRRGTSCGCSRRSRGCRSTSASSARATAACPSPCATRSRPAPAA